MAATQAGSFFEITATGDFQAVTLTADVKDLYIACKMDNTVFTNSDNLLEFHVSFFSDGTASVPVKGFSQEGPFIAGQTICYVKAAAGTIISVVGIK